MNRTLALCIALGWQGGTIHQVAKETGVSSTELLYAEPDTTTSDYKAGFLAGKNKTELKGKGKDFWIGVADGISGE